MDRPQWLYRHGVAVRPFRWRAREWKVDLHYNTLDVDPDDTDNFFKVVGQPLEEPTFRELISAAEYRRRHSVAVAQARRITAMAAHVEEYLKIKQWRIRLRHAVSDLEWNFEPYRQQYQQRKREAEAAAKREVEAAKAAEATKALEAAPPATAAVTLSGQLLFYLEQHRQKLRKTDCPTCGWVLRTNDSFFHGQRWFCGRCGFTREVQQDEKVDV